MTKDEELDLDLSKKFLELVLDEKIPFEDKKNRMDFLIQVGADIYAKFYGKTLLSWAKGVNDDKVIKYLKENKVKDEGISKEDALKLGRQFWDEKGRLKSVDEIKKLVNMGANLGAECEDGEDDDGYIMYKQIWKDLDVKDMNKILNDLPKGYIIDGKVDLAYLNLVELPDFSNVKVRGFFKCSHNRGLVSLEGAPKVVYGDFYCGYNELKTLKGAPEFAGRNFICECNLLTTLEGAPKEVKGSFFCRRNMLTTLKGAPEKIGGFFDCRYNKSLVSFVGEPKVIGGEFLAKRRLERRLERRKSRIEKGSLFERMFGGRER